MRCSTQHYKTTNLDLGSVGVAYVRLYCSIECGPVGSAEQCCRTEERGGSVTCSVV